MTPKNSESTPETSQAPSKISRSNAHQRVFLKSGTIIQRPPVLFRVPNMQNADSLQTPAVSPAVAGAEGHSPASQLRRDDAQNPTISLPHQSISSTTADGSAVAAGPSGRDRGGIETLSSRMHETTLRIDVPRSDSISRTSESSSGKANVASPNFVRTQSPIKFAFPADEDRLTIVHPPKSASVTSAASENLNQGNQTDSRTSVVEVERSTARSAYAIPPLDPVPEGRNWMEMLGSRLMIFLVIGAIAAIAYIANKSGNFPSEATIADLEDESLGTSLSTKSTNASNSSDAPANPSLSSQASELQAQEDFTSTANSKLSEAPNSAAESQIGSRRSDGSATTGNHNDQVAANQPDFDLESLLDDAAPDYQSNLVPPQSESSRQGNRSSTIPSIGLSDNSPRMSLNSNTAATPASTPLTTTSSASQVVIPQTATPQNQQDPLNNRIGGANQSGVSGSVIRESQPSTTPNLLQGFTGPLPDSGPVPNSGPVENPSLPTRGVTPDEAIRRATEAAVSGGFDAFSVPPNGSNAGSPSVDPVTGLRMTQNPLPIPDWTRYLPAPPAILNPAINTHQGNQSTNTTIPGMSGPNPYQNVLPPQQSAPNNYQIPNSQMPVVPGGMINPNPPTGRNVNGQSSNISAAGYGASMAPAPTTTNSQNAPANPYAIPSFPDSQGRSPGVGYPSYPPTLP